MDVLFNIFYLRLGAGDILFLLFYVAGQLL